MSQIINTEHNTRSLCWRNDGAQPRPWTTSNTAPHCRCNVLMRTDDRRLTDADGLLAQLVVCRCIAVNNDLTIGAHRVLFAWEPIQPCTTFVSVPRKLPNQRMFRVHHAICTGTFSDFLCSLMFLF